MDEFEQLRCKYEKEVLRRISDFIYTNDEREAFYWECGHIKSHFNYHKVFDLVIEYYNEGYVDCSKIDEIIAPVMTDNYRIYDSFPRGRGGSGISYESRSDGSERVEIIIKLLSNVEHSQFPKLKEGLIRVLSNESRPYRNSKGQINKFDVSEIKEKSKEFVPDDLFEEIFGESKGYTKVYDK